MSNNVKRKEQPTDYDAVRHVVGVLDDRMDQIAGLLEDLIAAMREGTRALERLAERNYDQR